jgi:hypothetical protein
MEGPSQQLTGSGPKGQSSGRIPADWPRLLVIGTPMRGVVALFEANFNDAHL